MKKLIAVVFSLLIAVAMSGCGKISLQHIIMINKSANPYTVYLDGASNGTIRPYEEKSFDVSKGYHTVRVVQQSGYVIYPTDETYYFNVKVGEDYRQNFPDDPYGK
ncbi:MAG: hypothetical protein J6W84_10340 [Bacteroidales bacterium]|nr:hypothetical protein [Bacteroidales bacterium]MBQ7490793.1 hypothetical protein [Bacteroidales bacterium]